MSTQNIIFTVVAVVFVIFIVVVGGTKKAPETTTPTNTTATTTTETTTKAKETVSETNSKKPMTSVVMTTNKGAITIELFADTKPNTVANFVKLANEGFYNGTRFHRVIKGFMIQGGDPLSKDMTKQAYWGTGGPGYQFADEIGADNKNVIGSISMANSGPNTNGSQFFINTADNNFLNPKHTAFGRVTAGMEVVTAIENTKTGAQDRPVEDMIIEKIEVK
jgi:cyclophilin family peptidyl-prolyl cis-trans isomerase